MNPIFNKVDQFGEYSPFGQPPTNSRRQLPWPFGFLPQNRSPNVRTPDMSRFPQTPIPPGLGQGQNMQQTLQQLGGQGPGYQPMPSIPGFNPGGLLGSPQGTPQYAAQQVMGQRPQGGFDWTELLRRFGGQNVGP